MPIASLSAGSMMKALMAALLGMIAALTLRNIWPGPLLFQTEPAIVYGFMSSMMIANIITLLVMLFGIRLFARLIDAPR